MATGGAPQRRQQRPHAQPGTSQEEKPPGRVSHTPLLTKEEHGISPAATAAQENNGRHDTHGGCGAGGVLAGDPLGAALDQAWWRSLSALFIGMLKALGLRWAQLQQS